LYSQGLHYNYHQNFAHPENLPLQVVKLVAFLSSSQGLPSLLFDASIGLSDSQNLKILQQAMDLSMQSTSLVPYSITVIPTHTSDSVRPTFRTSKAHLTANLEPASILLPLFIRDINSPEQKTYCPSGYTSSHPYYWHRRPTSLSEESEFDFLLVGKSTWPRTWRKLSNFSCKILTRICRLSATWRETVQVKGDHVCVSQSA
jgi:hypothetical protein